ncbi:MAG: hypothetical protein F6J94_12790 [Moorea sp. SIO1F2]|uniref:hypothetical protein n=1 Tax=Moorena sp. SIO1F2 TaxID=2607819 RepID=UPI0013B7301B|nr:hypothetical protein [Moorena sp. SIO1F2]NET82767.1 hypothetical protein [Moorena sp. SIO1F2]
MSTINISDDRLNTFYNQNPDFDILQFNFRNGQADNLNWENLVRSPALVGCVTLSLTHRNQTQIKPDITKSEQFN